MNFYNNVRTEYFSWIALISTAALIQLFLALNTPYPYVIESGDNGSILYIIARWIDAAAFEQDALLGVEGSTNFYQAALMWPNYIMGLLEFQLGLFYIIACFPMVLAQMSGFYVLGKRLFGHSGFALALAFITLPAVFTIAGDLWGMHNSPLMRTAFGASLPWLLLLLITPKGPRPYALMLAAGLASYLHLPSGPPVALGLLLICFLRALLVHGILRATLHHIFAGLLYLLILLPYLFLYTNEFAMGDTEALGIYATSPYGNVPIALDHLFSLRGPSRMSILVGRVPGLEWAKILTKPLLGALFLTGSLALIGLSVIGFSPLRLRHKLGLETEGSWFLVAGFFVATVGLGIALPAVDQAIARAYERGPVQVDLIRATRFIVPGAFTGVFFVLAWIYKRYAFLRSASLVMITVLTALVWIIAYPSTSRGFYRLTTGLSVADTSLRDFGHFTLALKERDDLDILIPVLRYDYQSSALRYIGYLPLRFNRKDNNFITYTGVISSSEHRTLMGRIDAIRKARRKSEHQAPLIDEFTRVLGGRDIVIDRRVVLAEAEALLLDAYNFEMIFELGDFALLRRK
jgi:hypothetical protein